MLILCTYYQYFFTKSIDHRTLLIFLKVVQYFCQRIEPTKFEIHLGTLPISNTQNWN